MKWDRLFVFIVAVVFVGWANVVPNTFPGRLRPRLPDEMDL